MATEVAAADLRKATAKDAPAGMRSPQLKKDAHVYYPDTPRQLSSPRWKEAGSSGIPSTQFHRNTVVNSGLGWNDGTRLRKTDSPPGTSEGARQASRVQAAGAPMAYVNRDIEGVAQDRRQLRTPEVRHHAQSGRRGPFGPGGAMPTYVS